MYMYAEPIYARTSENRPHCYVLDVFYPNKKELNRPENHVTITYTVKKSYWFSRPQPAGDGKIITLFYSVVSMQFASWSYDGLLVNLVAPDGGADLTNYVPVSFFF